MSFHPIVGVLISAAAAGIWEKNTKSVWPSGIPPPPTKGCMEAQDQNPRVQPQVQAGVPPESSACRGTVLTFLLDGKVVCQVLHRKLPIRNTAIPLWTSMSS